MKINGRILIYLLIITGLVIINNRCKKDNNTAPKPELETLNDIDSNHYHIVSIAAQTWMVENLKTTRYNDGTVIPFITDDAIWSGLTSPGYSWYDNDSISDKNTYGALYNWYAVNTGKLCPAGWHVPSDAEWSMLINNMGIDSVAGGKLIEEGSSHWQSNIPGATNESEFTALPGGYRGTSGTFFYKGLYCSFWSSTANDTISAWYRDMGGNTTEVERGTIDDRYGFSVRCIKDN